MNTEVRFGLLGSFEFRVAGRGILLRSPKCRILLAALLAEPGRLVPAAELIEAIWGSRQPDNPRRALHVCLTRARATLAGVGVPQLIVSGADGYRADIPPESVDVMLFRRWMEEADAAAERLDRGAECKALAEAMRLWRGEPFADVPSDYLHRRYGIQLAEERLQTLERRIDRNLEAGLHAEVVGELTELTGTSPLRERFWAQRMTALYRTGRRADALDVYHLVRRHLAEELGLEPGEELQRLHAKILSGIEQDGPSGARISIVPRQLPSEVSGFAGRAAEVEQMHRLLEEHERGDVSGSTVLVITGMAGVGKTTLATHWSRRVADRFPDGQLWLDLRGYDRRTPATPQQSIVSILHASGMRGDEVPPDLDSQIGLYRSVMDGRRMLLVLDNANGVDQIMPLLPGDARTFVLITSRSDLASLIAVEGAHAIRLNPFTAAEARQMLEPRLGSGRLSAEPDAVSRIVDNCYGLPLALAIVAARAVGRPNFPLLAMERQLADANTPLDRFSDPEIGLDVRAVFSWSYRSLTPHGARLFRLLGLHPTADVSIAASACLLDTTQSYARLLLDELAAAHLVTEHVPGRFTLHDLLHAYAAELAVIHDSPEQRSADLRRLLDWMTRTTLNARPLLQPSETFVTPQGATGAIPPLTFEDERAAREWYEAERDTLIASMDVAYAHGFDDLCWRLAFGSWIYLQLTDAWGDLLRTHATALQAAERLGDQIGQALILVGMGIAHRSTGNAIRALEMHRMALAIFRATGNVNGTANVFSNLSAAYRDTGDFDESLRCAERSYTLEEALDEPGNMAISLYQIAMTLTAAGRAGDAVPRITTALELVRRLGHRRAEARGLQLAATVYMRLGQHQTAIEQYRTALTIYRDLNDHWYQAAVLTELGDALQENQRLPESRDAWSHALAIYDELGAPQATELRAKLHD